MGRRGDFDAATGHFENAIYLMAWDFRIWMDYAQYWAQQLSTAYDTKSRKRIASRLIESLENALTIAANKTGNGNGDRERGNGHSVDEREDCVRVCEHGAEIVKPKGRRENLDPPARPVRRGPRGPANPWSVSERRDRPIPSGPPTPDP